MKSLHVRITEPLDDALTVEATRRGVSKAALVREYLRQGLASSYHSGEDPVAALIGDIVDEAGNIDTVVYPR